VKQNDLWYFPSGIPHSIQGLGPDGTEFMLVFDDGTFSEQETALLSDSMAHLPPEVLAKNFGVAEQAMNNLPKQELFIFQTEVPGSLEDDQKAAAGDLGKSPIDFAFRTMEMPPTKNTKGGEVRIVDSSKFKVSTTIAMAMVTVHPGGLRELHWHPNADEWQYYIAGKGRMTVVDMGNKGRTMDFQAGDVGYVEKSLLHWATSDTTGDLGLQDAWARYHIPHTPFALEAGQIRDPVDHEQIMFATKTLTPGRSIVNNVLLNGDDIVKGASISYGYDGDNPFRTELAFTSGERNFDTNFEDFPTNSANWGAAGRFEYKLFGDWNDYNQFTGLNNKQPLLVLGAGLDYTEAGAAGALTHVADVQYTLPNGLSLYGAYLGRYVRDNGGSPTTNGTLTSLGPTFDTYDASARVMAAYLIKEHWEPSQDSNGSISMAANCRPARTMSYMMPRWV
jgi:oxalate decarboxylase/phosphoglucose isomerase-like protein (cupin superfamily)